MSNGPYAVSTATGTAWPQGKPTDPDEWSEEDLNAWLDEQLTSDMEFMLQWCVPEWFTYPDGAAW